MKTAGIDRYSSVAIFLHWTIAAAIFFMLGSGTVMVYGDLEQATQFQVYQWHKGAGVLLLLAVILRLAWRLISKVPPLPIGMPNWETIAAKLGHYGLYALMILMPLTGWVIVSASVYGLPTIVFGWFTWPHIPGLQGNAFVEEIAETAHLALAIALGLFIAVHIAAVIKHYWLDRENLLKRMWW